MPSFIKCSNCGKIFSPSAGETECSTCRGEGGGDLSKRELLRSVKNYIRDLMVRGEFVTIADTASALGVEQTVVWDFIQSGEIDLTPFDDPQVRNFLVNKRREQDKIRGGDASKPAESDNHSAPRPSGFHSSDRSGRGR